MRLKHLLLMLFTASTLSAFFCSASGDKDRFKKCDPLLSGMISRTRDTSRAIRVSSLHTTLLEERFGKDVVVRVLDQSGCCRAVEIAAKGKGDIGGVYTIAFSTPNDPMPAALGKVHHRISQLRESMGRSFEKEGILVRKLPIDEKIITLPEALKKDFGTEAATAVLRIYEFYGELPNGELVLYSTVAELDSPTVTSVVPQELRAPPFAEGPLTPAAQALHRYAHEQLKKFGN